MKKLFLFVLISIVFWFSWVQANFTLSPLKFEYDLQNFNPVQDKIKVTNSWDTPITLYSSKEDFVAGDDSGAPKFVPPEDQLDTQLSLSNWITVEDQNITLAPKETREINFTVQIPSNAEPGWHYAAIFFSPGVPGGAQVAVVQRLWVLLLVNVPWEVKIDGNVKNFEIGKTSWNNFVKSDRFDWLPIIFQTVFQNSWNVHLKPTWKITLIDENGNTLKNIWKQPLLSPAGTFLGETLVDYIPVNDSLWNVLPQSERKFQHIWEGFGYTVLNDDGSKSVKFKDLTTYYADNAAQQAQFLMFWESIKTRTVEKKITAQFELSYTGKDKEAKEFLDKKDFFVTYEEKYIGINMLIVGLLLLIVIGWGYYSIKVLPEKRKQKEEELRKKIMEEMNQNK